VLFVSLIDHELTHRPPTLEERGKRSRDSTAAEIPSRAIRTQRLPLRSHAHATHPFSLSLWLSGALSFFSPRPSHPPIRALTLSGPPSCVLCFFRCKRAGGPVGGFARKDPSLPRNTQPYGLAGTAAAAKKSLTSPPLEPSSSVVLP
jgi:hypothetical protein